MRALAKEWWNKAEDDLYSAGLLLRAGEIPMPGNSCFHSQQCAEKYLKGFLTEYEVDFPRTHQLMVLVELCTAIDPSFGEISRLARRLEGYAVSVRYPGVAIGVDAAEKALQTASNIRDFVRSKLD
jgi:HEPN domain-containing protein